MSLKIEDIMPREFFEAIRCILGDEPAAPNIMRLMAEIELMRKLNFEDWEDKKATEFLQTFPDSYVHKSAVERGDEATKACRVLRDAQMEEILIPIGRVYAESPDAVYRALHTATGDVFSSYMNLAYFYRSVLWPKSKVCSTHSLYEEYIETLGDLNISYLPSEGEFYRVFKTAHRYHTMEEKLRISGRATQIGKLMNDADVSKSAWDELYYNCMTYLLGKEKLVKSPVDYLDSCTGSSDPSIHALCRTGRSIANEICLKLIELKPAEYFNMAVVADGNDRVSLELGFICAYVKAYQGKRICIINPTPMLMKHLCADKKLDCMFTFSDQQHSKILKLDKKIEPYINDTCSAPVCDVAFFLPPFTTVIKHKRESNAEMNEIYYSFQHFLSFSSSSPKRVYALLPDAILSQVYEDCENKSIQYAIDTIHILPEKVDKSVPSRKCFVKFKKDSSMTAIHLKRFSIVTIDGKRGIIATDDRFRIVLLEDLKKYGNIRATWRYTHSGEGNSKRSLPGEYGFSVELSIYYNIERTGRIKAYLCMPPTDQQKKNKLARGKQIEESIATSEKISSETIPTWIETEYLKKPAVRKIVEGMYPSRQHQTLSIKLYFYLHQSDIQRNLLEEKWEAAYTILCNGIGTLILEQVVQQDMALFLEEIPQEERDLTVDVLNAIFTTAVYLRHIRRNPLEETIQKYRKERDRLREVRSLTKRNLTRAEESALVALLLELIEDNPLAIALLLRLFTGVSSRVVLALQWKDISMNKIYGFATIRIVRELSTDGMQTEDLQRKFQYRQIPIHPGLFAILRAYRDRLRENLPTRETLPKTIFVDENGSFLKVRHLTALTKKLVAKLNIPEETIILPGAETESIEMKLSLHPGDIFTSNFYSRLIDANFTDGELCYIRGTTPSDTIYAHYIQMSEMDILNILYDKLRPWQDRFFPNDVEKEVRTKKVIRANGAFILRIKNGNSGGKELRIRHPGNTNIRIVAVRKGEENNATSIEN